jgi:hypothetical protein
MTSCPFTKTHSAWDRRIDDSGAHVRYKPLPPRYPFSRSANELRTVDKERFGPRGGAGRAMAEWGRSPMERSQDAFHTPR